MRGPLLILALLWASLAGCQAQFGVEQPFFLTSASVADINNYPQQAILSGFFDTKSDDLTIRSNTIVTNWVNLANASNPATNTVKYGATWVASGGAGGYGYVKFSKSSPATTLTWHPTNGAPDVPQQKTPITIACVLYFGATNATQSLITAYGGAGQNDYGLFLGKGLSSYPNGIIGFGAGSADGIAPYVDSRAFPPTNVFYRVVATLGSHQMLFTNGVIASTNSGSVVHLYATGCDLGVGAYYGFDGGMHRLIFWRGELSSNECLQVDTQLKADFGL